MKRQKAVGNVTVATFVRACVATIALCFGALNARADYNINSDTQLEGDTDWTGRGKVVIAADATLDLKGYKLSVDAIAGTGKIVDLRKLGEDIIKDGAFETATVINGNQGLWGYIDKNDATNPNWTTSVPNRAGYTTAGSPWTGETGDVKGVFAAFVQMLGNLQQTVNVTEAGDYALTYSYKRRPGNFAQHELNVVVDGQICGWTLSDEDWAVNTVVLHLAAGNHTIKFDGITANDSTTILDDVSLRKILADATGELHFVVPEGEAEATSVKLEGEINLVKSGSGTLKIDDDIICSGRNLTVMAGKVVPNRTGRVKSAAKQGEIRIENGAQFDVNRNQNGPSLADTEVSHGKKIIVAGSGPDGTGALYNSQTASSWGATFGHIVLSGDTSIGGGRMDFCALAGSAVARKDGEPRIEGDYALTVLQGGFFVVVNANYDIKEINIQGTLAVQDLSTGKVTNGIHLESEGAELNFCRATVSADIPVVVDENVAAANITATLKATTMNSALTVGEGAQLNLKPAFDLVVNGPVTNMGSIVKAATAGVVKLGGTLVGNGTLAGGLIRFTGANARWAMAADDTGFTSKVDVSGVTDTAFLTELKAIDVTYTGRTHQTLDVCPSFGLTSEQAQNISLNVTDGDGQPLADCWLGVTDGKLQLHVLDSAIVATAKWTGGADSALDDPESWECRDENDNIMLGVLPTSSTVVDIPGGSVFNCTNGAPFECRRLNLPPYLVGNCDLRGVSSEIAGTLDLRGYKLFVRELNGAATITDSTELGEDLIMGGDFEATTISQNQGQWGYIYNSGASNPNWATGPAGSGCGAGYTKENSPWTFDVKGAVSAFLQKACDLYQTVEVTEAGDYALTYSYKSRKDSREGISIQLYPPHELNVEVDGQLCGKAFSAEDWAVNTVVLHLAVGSHTIKFVGLMTKDDRTTILDDVSLRKIPAAGELHVVVPENQTMEVTSVKLEGALKLVKEGAGTYLVSYKNGSGVKTSYVGGTSVREGCLMVHVPTSSSPHDYDFYETQPIGAQGSETTVEKDATFDCGGNYNGYLYTIVLNGGAYANLVPYHSLPDEGTPLRLRLTADSFLSAAGNTQLGETDLGGYTLDATAPQNTGIFLFDAVRNGTLINRGGRFYPLHDIDCSTVDLVLEGLMTCSRGTIPFHDLTVTCTAAEFGHGDNNFYTVSGTYTPVSDKVWRFKMLNGSTIDLSNLTTTLASPAASGLFFEENATVYVALGNRKTKSSVPLISWEEKPENVKFCLAPGTVGWLEAKEDGLYRYTGFGIIVR